MDINVTITTPFINRLARSCSMALLSLLIIIGNAFCFIIFRQAKNLPVKDTTKIFVASLTCSDLCLGVFGAIPVALSAGLGYFPSSSSMPVPLCLYHSVFTYFMSLTSCVSLLAVTAERYFAIVYPFRFAMLFTVRRCKIAVASLWIVQCIFMFIIVGVVQPQLSGMDEDLDPDYLICFPPSPASGVVEVKGSEGFFSLIFIFIVMPTLSIIFMYSRMLIIARRHTAHIKASISKTTAFAAVTLRRQAASERRAPVCFLIVTMASIIAWLPFTAVTFQEYVLWRYVEPHWKFLAVFFLFCGCWFNVVIYCILSENFRTAAKQIIFSRMFKFDLALPTTSSRSFSYQQ